MVEKDSQKLLNHMMTKEFASDLSHRFKKNSTYRFVERLKTSTINAKVLSDFARKVRIVPVDHYEEKNWTFFEMLDLALDIYKDFDEELYNRLKILVGNAHWFKEKPILKNAVKFLRAKGLYKKDKDVVFFADPSYKRNDGSVTRARKGIMRDIMLKPDKSVLGVLTLVHELAHWLCKRSEVGKVKEDASGEIFSMFMEHYAINWLRQKGFASEDDVEKFRIRNKNHIASRANVVLKENAFAKHFQNDRIKLNISDLTLQDVLDAQVRWSHQIEFRLHSNKILNDLMYFTYKDKKPAWFDYRYVYSGIVATILYKDFQNQPEETKFVIKQFIKHDDALNMEETELILLGGLAKDKIKNHFDKYFVSDQGVDLKNDTKMTNEEIDALLSEIECRERCGRWQGLADEEFVMTKASKQEAGGKVPLDIGSK